MPAGRGQAVHSGRGMLDGRGIFGRVPIHAIRSSTDAHHPGKTNDVADSYRTAEMLPSSSQSSRKSRRKKR